MAVTADKIFVNLPVKDLKKTTDFFSNLGFEFNAQFTDANAGCLVLGSNIFAMLLVEDFFKSFIKKEISDATKTTEVIVAISVQNREAVDELVDRALASGGKPASDPQDHGFMYVRSFQDLDGHLWEITYMDENALSQ
jgi:predicted lactoylglutathione lyase